MMHIASQIEGERCCSEKSIDAKRNKRFYMYIFLKLEIMKSSNLSKIIIRCDCHDITILVFSIVEIEKLFYV